MEEQILVVENLEKSFSLDQRKLEILSGINFTIQKGESVAIVGPSGSGKTTLLGLCAGLDVPTSGVISLAGIKLNAMGEDDRAYVRNQKVGFIFQNFQLLPTLTALENVLVPLELRGEKGKRKQAEELLGRVGLADRMDHYPTQLSGGEQQRVAIARAFISTPEILFADEPTGNLDEETAEMVTSILFGLNKEHNTTLITVTHNLELAHHTERIIELRGGKIYSDKALN